MTDEEDVFEEELESGWSPPATTRLHNGEMIPVDTDFFHDPPSEIGEIVSAQSSLVESKQPFPTPVRLLLTVGLSGAIFFGISVVFRTFMNGPDAEPMGYVVGAIASVVTLVCTLYFTRFRHSCTFVGKLGIAEFKLSGRRENVPKARVLLFEHCCDVTTWQLRQYVNGVYSGTQYKNIWRDAAGDAVFTLKGHYNSEAGTPKAASSYWFAGAAEGQWNEFALERMTKDYESQGYLDFRVKQKDMVRVGPGFLEFTFGGKSTRITPEDIKTLSIANGSFTIHTKEARWFSSKGKFGFEYGGMGNAKLFLFALEQLAGYTFS